jgi:hypothetical protein
MGMDFSMGGNEYMDSAESARRSSKGLGLGLDDILQGITQALGISKPVRKAPKGDSADTGDLASQPLTQRAKVTDDKGDVISAIEVASQPTGITRLSMAPAPVPETMIEIDPDTGLPLIKLPGAKASNNFGTVR